MKKEIREKLVSDPYELGFAHGSEFLATLVDGDSRLSEGMTDSERREAAYADYRTITDLPDFPEDEPGINAYLSGWMDGCA